MFRSIKKRYIVIGLLFLLLLLGIQRGSSITIAGSIISNYATLYAKLPDGSGGEYGITRNSNLVQTTVAKVHGIDLNTNTPQTILPGAAAYFPKVITNIGNTTENVILITSNVTSGWAVQLIEDANRDGIYQTGESVVVPSSLDIPPTRDYRFFVVLYSPASFNVVGTVNLTVSASASGLGVYTGSNNITYGGPMRVSETNTASTTVTPSAGGPVISDIMFDGVPMISKDYIGRSPFITARILDPDGVDTASITISIDGVATTSGITFDGVSMYYKVPATLGDGDHVFIISARDISGALGSKQIIGRITDKVKIVGEILAYPNPYNPTDGRMKICYQLTNDTGIKIYLHSIVGERVWKEDISSGSDGGRTGYNEVWWDGNDGFYDMVANGVYIAHIMSDKGKLLGKVKILVIR